MPRREIEFTTGEIYHLFNRGAGKSAIFLAPEYYHFFITKMWVYSKSLNLPVIAFCLMPNHYHLLVMQAGDNPAGNLAQRICNSYSKAFNNWTGRKGTHFEGRYHAKHVGSQNYLEYLCAYIHMNPASSDIVDRPELWPYSDYHRWVVINLHAQTLKIHIDLGLPVGDEYRGFLEDVLAGRKIIPETVTKFS